jgi:HK97 family phage major capsid protein
MPLSLLDQRAAALASANQVVTAAKSAGRSDLTATEVKAINDRLAEVDALDLKIAAADESSALLKRLGGTAGFSPTDSGVLAPQFKALHEAARAGQSISVEVPRKAFVAVSLPPIVTGTLVPGDYPGGSPRILDLFAPGQASGPTVRVYRVSSPGTAGQVAEGEQKPDAGIEVEPVDIAMVKIANTCKLSDDLTEDQPTFIGALQSELGMAVLSEENAYAAATILASSGLLTATGTNAIDGVADAIATLAATFGAVADAVVLNPSDLATIRKAKAVTSGDYLSDPFTAGPPSLHGLPITVTTRVAVGTVLVGSFKTAGTAFTRTALRIDLGLDTDDFSRNLRTARAEERVALGVTRPSHLVKLTVS